MLLSQCSTHLTIYMSRVDQREKLELEVRGLRADGCREYRIAYILGIHFKAGEWGQSRCGSVVTTMHGGRSRYAVVEAFINADGEDFAVVSWFGKPQYPYAPIPLVSRVTLLNPERQILMPRLLPLNKIDPTTVIIEPDDNGREFYMMRVLGWDRLPGTEF